MPGASSTRAMPKSVSRTRIEPSRSLSISTLSGFRSRCTTARPCAALSPSATCASNPAASAVGMVPRCARYSRRFPPRTRSITRASAPSRVISRSRTRTMLRCRSDNRIDRSCRNRATALACPMCSTCSTLTATSRPLARSRPCQTVAAAPRPISSTRSYDRSSIEPSGVSTRQVDRVLVLTGTASVSTYSQSSPRRRWPEAHAYGSTRESPIRVRTAH
jgi:hypothetical protein